jgi:pilus assembly protein CpaE
MMDAPLTQAEPAPAAARELQNALVFVRDRDSEGVIRQCLSDLGVAKAQFFTGGIDTATAQLGQAASPRLLVVDVSGIEDATQRTEALAAVCEPGTGVVLIGEANDIRLYRSLKGAGVAEYFFKPLANDLVKRAFNAILSGSAEMPSARTGKLVIALSVRGGAGGTMIAATTAWHLAEVRQRRVILLDLDLHFGDAALQFDAVPSHALCEALQHPERVDELFLERGVTQVTERLSLLSSLEPITDTTVPDESAVLSLLETLLQRYRYVFVDLPAMLAPNLMRVLHLPSVCLLVSTGSLVAARDVARWREAIGTNSAERSFMHILNKSGAHDSLPEDEFVKAAGHAADMVIPYSRDVGLASNMGIRGIHKCAVIRRELSPLLQHLAGEAVEGARPSLLRRLFG